MPRPLSYKTALDNLIDSVGLPQFRQNLSQLETIIHNLPEEKQQQKTVQLQKAVDTAKRVGQIKITPKMQQALDSILVQNIGPDEISDEQARRNAGIRPETRPKLVGQIPKTPGKEVGPVLPMKNLPAIINKQLAVKSNKEPKWHMVKNLPGYLSNPIRSLGRSIFKYFTATPIEEIQVLANFHGQQEPNTEQEIKMVASWLQKNAVKLPQKKLLFETTIPGYDADVVVYETDGYEFMVVKDFAGYYIYAYNGKQNTKRLSQSSSIRKLIVRVR